MDSGTIWSARNIVVISGMGVIVGLAAGVYYGQLGAALGFFVGSLVTAFARA